MKHPETFLLRLGIWGGFLAAVGLASAGLIAAEIYPIPKLTYQEPGKTPEQIILTWRGDPARSQAVSWRTAKPVANPQAQVAPLTSLPEFTDSTVTVPVQTSNVALENGEFGEAYTAEFQGLKPDSKYNYRVGDGKTWSEWNVFRTASTQPNPFRFVYVGDAQNDIRSLWARTIRVAFATAPDMRFMIHAGDLVNEGYDDRFWKQWTDALGFISAMVPSIPVVGNHEIHHAPGSSDPNSPLAAPPAWRQHFPLPMNGPRSLRGQSYFLDYQGTRFISLDVNVFDPPAKSGTRQKEIQDEEVAWLEQVLRDNPNHWTIVAAHYPMYTIAKGRTPFGDMETRLLPLYDRYHVDLVLQGHEHGYGRTHKMRAGRPVPENEAGTIYAISVSGPDVNEVEPLDPPFFAKTIEALQLFQVISVSPEKLQFDAYTLEGTIADSFTLRKTAGADKTNNRYPPAK